MFNGITPAQAHEVLQRAEQNFLSTAPLDIDLLDQVMYLMNREKGDVQVQANLLLVKLQEQPETWTKVDVILSCNASTQTKYFALQVLESAIKTKWRSLPLEQREGVKAFIAKLIIETCDKEDEGSQTLLSKLNVVLVQIVKHDWPKNWPKFIPELIDGAQTNAKVCVNVMRILSLLSEDVFDFGSSNLTQAKERYLKTNFCGQFQDIFTFCLRLLEECPANEIVKACLKTLRRFMTWIPLTYVYDTNFLELIIGRFLPLDAYRLPALQCLTEICGINQMNDLAARENEKLAQYRVTLKEAYYKTIEVLFDYIGAEFDMAKAYATGTEETQLFVASLADFLVGFLKENAELVEPCPPNYNEVHAKLHAYAIQLLLSLSTVDDIEIFKVCLDFWLILTQDLYRDDPFCKPAGNQLTTMFSGITQQGVQEPPRKSFYRPHLSDLRTIIIGRMAKPEEVLVVENDQGEVVRELVKDTDSITLYKTMRETLVFLTHLDSKDTEEKMTEKLSEQVNSSEFSWKALNTLCWAIGSVSMTMAEEEEKRFLVLVIRDLLGLCEQKRGKDNKAVIASNIMYIVGQYPRFLRQHWKFLKTVVNKLFEFMHESHEGVQDMACDTFIKIAIKCKRHFTIVQMGEKEPFIEEMLRNLASNICDLSPPQVHVFYEAMGHIISSKHEPVEQKELITKLMELPNHLWHDTIRRANSDVSLLGDVEILKNTANILKTNTAACRSIGSNFSIQLLRNYTDMLALYRLFSEQISKSIAENGDEILKHHTVKQVRAVKKEILVFISTWASKSEVAQTLKDEVVPELFEAVLFDYQRNVPAARDPKVLSLLAIIVSQLQDNMLPYVQRVLEAFFGCTLEMISSDFETYPEHRVNFFQLLYALVRECFPMILKLGKEELAYIVQAIVWGFQHTMRSVAELGLDILKEFFERCRLLNGHDLEDAMAAQQFYADHYMSILEHILAIVADSSHVHVAGLTYYADVMCALFRAAENDIKIGLSDSMDNMDFISCNIAALFREHYSANLNEDQIRVFVKGFFSYNRDVGAMKNHLRDFLIQIKETKGEDTSDLFLEEKEAQIMATQQAKSAVPGLLNPNEIYDEEDMEFRAQDVITFSRRDHMGPARMTTVAMLSQDMS